MATGKTSSVRRQTGKERQVIRGQKPARKTASSSQKQEAAFLLRRIGEELDELEARADRLLRTAQSVSD